MSLSGISYSPLSNFITPPGFQQRFLIQQEMVQVSQDLQSGNLSAAQADSAILGDLLPQYTCPSSEQSGNPIAQELNQLSQDLQAGNLSAAQQDFSTLQEYFPIQGLYVSTNNILSSNFITPPGFQNQILIQQQFQQLGQDLQSGNLSAATSDAAILGDLLPQYTSPTTSQTNNPIGQEITQLSEDLKAGNLSAAQQDYATLQEYLEPPSFAFSLEGGMSKPSPLTQSLNPTSQAPQSGGLITDPQIYASPPQVVQQLRQNVGQNFMRISLPAGLNRFSVLA